MLIEKLQQKKYTGQGFIEALLAIIIAGLAVVALMAVTASTLGQVARNEILDQLTQEAVYGANMLDYIVERWHFEGDSFSGELSGMDPFIDPVKEGSCFTLDGEVGNLRVNEVLSCNYSDADGINIRSCVKSPWNIPPQSPRLTSSSLASGLEDYRDTMFRLFCIQSDSQLDFSDPDVKQILVVRIYTGTESCASIEDPNLTMHEQRSIDESCILQEYNAVYPLDF